MAPEEIPKLASDTTVDVILLDLTAGASGASRMELLRRLVNARPERKVVVIARSTDQEFRIRVRQFGVASYIDDPFVADEFRPKVVRRAAGRAASQARVPIQNGAGAGVCRLAGEADASAPRAARIAHLLVSVASATVDAHSVDDLCRIGSVGAAPSTFRRWCQGERIRPSRVLDLARLLRALVLARSHGTSMLEWMDVDPRTFGALLRRAQVPDLYDGRLPTTREFIGCQRLVRNPVVLRLVDSYCRQRELDVTVTDEWTVAQQTSG